VHFANSKIIRGKEVEKICDVGSDPLMENLSSSFNLEAARFFAAMFRNSRQRPKGRRFNFDDKVLDLSLLKHRPKSYILLGTLVPLPSSRSLQPILNTVHLRRASMLTCFVHSSSLCRKCLVDHYCCLMFDEMSV
jgi:hypothetical protein